MKNHWKAVVSSTFIGLLLACQNFDSPSTTPQQSNPAPTQTSPCTGSCLDSVKDGVLHIKVTPQSACSGQTITLEGSNIKAALGDTVSEVTLVLLSKESNHGELLTHDKGIPPNPDTQGIKLVSFSLTEADRFTQSIQVPTNLKKDVSYGVLLQHKNGFTGSDGEFKLCSSISN